MARTASKPKPLTYALSYGLAGGPFHARSLMRYMKAAKFIPATLETADIIIAHSAGCWLIPSTATPRLVVYVGMPLAQTHPTKTFLQAQRNSSRYNRLSSQFKIRLISTYYLLIQPQHNKDIVRMASHARPIIFPKAKTVLIANHHDPWPKSKTLDDYLSRYNWSFISMEGAHDDIGIHPERYVEVIKHYARLLG